MSDIAAEEPWREGLAALTAKVEQLQAELDALRLQHQMNLSSETLLAISGAVAAYLGHKTVVRQIRVNTDHQWVNQVRSTLQSQTPTAFGSR